MTGTLRGVCLLLWILTLGECKLPEQVTCVFSRDCMLPCTFTPTATMSVLIHWYRQDVLLDSFLSAEDQSEESSSSSKVSMFKEQVSQGNASLLLRHSTPADRGRYTCRVNTTEAEQEDSIVIVKVEAPISSISIGLTPDRSVQCLTRGVYPAPSLQWETDPPSPPSQLRSSNRVTPDPQGLYDAEGTLMTLSRPPARVTYVCSVRTKYTQQLWRATLVEGADITGVSGRSLLVPCITPKPPPEGFTLSWTFSQDGRNPAITLLTYDSRTQQTSSSTWQGRVELDQEQVLLGNGSLRLLSPESGENTGSYACNFAALQTRHVVQTWVNVTGPQTARRTGENKETELWVVAVVVIVLGLLIIAVFICKRRRARSQQKDIVIEDTEMQPMQPDAEVTCLFQEDCMLPCRFLRGGMVIHWYKQQIPVHSYYYQKDQLRLQNKHFSGRTHLFNALVSHGNASLLLRRVKVQDQGRYKCFTSTRKDSQETFINLHVKAPIPLVRMEMTNESVTCMSQNIYPAPEVLWSTDPPVAPCALVNSTRKTPDSRGLFSIESRVGIVGNVSDFTYFCSVRSADGSQEWTASRRQQDDLFGESGRSLLIPCITRQPNQNFTLSWSFNRGRNPVTLLTYDSRTQQTSSSTWQGRVELDQEQVLLGNGSLRLLSPESGENTGSYTCTLSAFQTKHVVQVWVNVTDRSAGGAHGHVNGGKVVKLCMSQIESAMPGHVMVIHCEPERPPKDQTQGLGSANSDSYFLKLALFPSSHKDLSSSIAPNKLEGDENVFIVPEQFQIHGLR
ncbi:uncharacterized protein hhla2a.1 [Engraulis encrasicolus]|uniref:uncharacterized protein hhla2a.1 n=1 Tax=Engraulis encrasicolus TaxID=184585 RepID=UPI002FCF7EA3